MSFPRERIVSEGKIPEKYLIRATCPVCGTEFRATIFEAEPHYDRCQDHVRLGLRCPTCAFFWLTNLYVSRALIYDLPPFGFSYMAKAEWETREGRENP